MHCICCHRPNNFSILARYSSIEHPSGGEADHNVIVGTEENNHDRRVEGFSSPIVHINIATNKSKRDKMTNKGQQDDEEERGKFIITFYRLNK